MPKVKVKVKVIISLSDNKWSTDYGFMYLQHWITKLCIFGKIFVLKENSILIFVKIFSIWIKI